MTTYYEIPLTGSPQRFAVSLPMQGQVVTASYLMTFQYRDADNDMGGWILDIADSVGNPIVCGIPLITGADLLEQYGYLGLGGQLWVWTEVDPAEVPTFDNLGTGSHVFWVTEP